MTPQCRAWSVAELGGGFVTPLLQVWGLASGMVSMVWGADSSFSSFWYANDDSGAVDMWQGWGVTW